MPAAFEGQTVEQALLEDGLYVGRASAQDDVRVGKRTLDLALVAFFAINVLGITYMEGFEQRLFPLLILYRMITRPHPFTTATPLEADTAAGRSSS